MFRPMDFQMQRVQLWKEARTTISGVWTWLVLLLCGPSIFLSTVKCKRVQDTFPDRFSCPPDRSIGSRKRLSALRVCRPELHPWVMVMLFSSSLITKCDVVRVFPSRVIVLSLTLSLATVVFSAIPAGGAPSKNLIAPPSRGVVYFLEMGVLSFAVPFSVTSIVRFPR